ncbi:MAG: GNAT family N-acetyltransferase [Paracoccaceae bacterium]
MQLVYYRAVREGTVAHYDEAQRAHWAPRDTPDLSKPDKLLKQWCWVAEEGGQITGFMSLAYDGLLDMAFVIPEVMGKGTAAALYDTLLAKARAQSLPRLTVDASIYSHGFLRKRGWKVDWQGPRIYNGVAYHGYYMSLALDQTPKRA